MAIIKAVKGIGKTHSSLQKLIDYIGEKASLTTGIDCSNDYKDVAEEFRATKEFYDKTDERQYKHIIQSFKHGEITSEKAKEIAVEFCEKAFKGFEVFIATHNDKEHIHNHIVLNSVNLETGLKYQEKNKDLVNLKKINNEICKSHSLSIPQKSQEKGKVIAWNKKKYVMLKKATTNEKESDILNLTKHVLTAKKNAVSKIDFIDIMKKNGVETSWTEQKKNITFEIKENLIGKKSKFRLENLKKTFNLDELTKENLEDEFIRNEQSRKRCDERGIGQLENGTRNGSELGTVHTLESIRNERAIKLADEKLERETRERAEKKSKNSFIRKSSAYSKSRDLDRGR
ncbi:MAG: relaxase/mobilization nuclease domain-containing protein [Fusobacteriaceae bacterium]